MRYRLKEIVGTGLSLSRKKRARVLLRHIWTLAALFVMLFALSGVTLAGSCSGCDFDFTSETPRVLSGSGSFETSQLSKVPTWTSFYVSKHTSGDLGSWHISIETRKDSAGQASPSQVPDRVGLCNGTVTTPLGSSGVSSTEQTQTGRSVFRIRFYVSGGLPVGTGKVFIGEDGRKTWIIRIPIGSPQNPPDLSPETPTVPGSGSQLGDERGNEDQNEPGDESPDRNQDKSGNQTRNAEGGSTEQQPKKNTFLTEKEQEMLELVNAERNRAGLDPLVADEVLTRLARMKSEDMIEKGYFSHNSPTYGSPFDMMRKAGVKYITAGENLAGAPTVERAHTGLMNSEGHRRNILNPSFKRIGIGIIEGGPYGLMVTQMFTG